MTKKEGRFKLKNAELLKRDHALDAVFQGFRSQLEEARCGVKLEEKKALAVMKAYENLVPQTERQFDTSVNAVI